MTIILKPICIFSLSLGLCPQSFIIKSILSLFLKSTKTRTYPQCAYLQTIETWLDMRSFKCACVCTYKRTCECNAYCGTGRASNMFSIKALLLLHNNSSTADTYSTVGQSSAAAVWKNKIKKLYCCSGRATQHTA